MNESIHMDLSNREGPVPRQSKGSERSHTLSVNMIYKMHTSDSSTQARCVHSNVMPRLGTGFGCSHWLECCQEGLPAPGMMSALRRATLSMPSMEDELMRSWRARSLFLRKASPVEICSATVQAAVRSLQVHGCLIHNSWRYNSTKGACAIEHNGPSSLPDNAFGVGVQMLRLFHKLGL